MVLANQTGGIGSSKLLKYSWSEDTPSKPSKELKLYSLRDNTDIRQAISLFQKENADYYINFQTGISGEDGTTVSDALKTLNADIMAGKGPDIRGTWTDCRSHPIWKRGCLLICQMCWTN